MFIFQSISYRLATIQIKILGRNSRFIVSGVSYYSDFNYIIFGQCVP